MQEDEGTVVKSRYLKRFRYKGNDENEEAEPSEKFSSTVQRNLTVINRRMFQSENQ